MSSSSRTRNPSSGRCPLCSGWSKPARATVNDIDDRCGLGVRRADNDVAEEHNRRDGSDIKTSTTDHQPSDGQKPYDERVDKVGGMESFQCNCKVRAHEDST